MYPDPKWLSGFCSHGELSTKGSVCLFCFWAMGVRLESPISLIMCEPVLALLTLSSTLLAMKLSCASV